LEGDEDVEGLFVAADKYAIESLKEECAVRLSKNLTAGNVARNLVLAHLHNSATLHKSALGFMVKTTGCSRKADWRKMIKYYPELTLQVIERLLGNYKKKQTNKRKLLENKKTHCNGFCLNIKVME
jgi:hypothetical protein